MRIPASPVFQFDSAQFVGMFAQELRHPLVPIRNAVATLREASHDPAAVLRVAEIIEREADNMNRLIGDLVDVAQLQSGTLELSCKRAPLSELMERAVGSAGASAKDHGQRLSVSVSPEPVYLQMDVSRLCHALHNLIVNACTDTRGGGHVHIRAQRYGMSVSIVVSDNGSPTHGALDDLVQAGQEAGLYLARCFVEAHGGTLTATGARTRRGGEITISLPCEASTAMVPESADEEPAVDRTPA